MRVPRVNGAVLEKDRDEVGNCSDNDQRDHQCIAAGHFHDQEDSRERRMKRGCENAAHSERNEIRVVGFLPVKQVEEPFQKKAGKGARKEGRRKEPA